jgi:hypothetical protein
MSFSTLASRPRRPVVPSLPAPPHRVSLWPLDDARYGLDLTYVGSWACEDAEQTAACLGIGRVSHTLRPGEADTWTLPLGPLTSLQVASALESLLGASPA